MRGRWALNTHGWWIVVLTLLLWGCATPPTPLPVPTPQLIRVVGSSDLTPVVDVMREALASSDELVNVQFMPTNSSVGWRQLRQGKADVALLSQAPEKVPESVQLIPVGQDAIAIIVHPRVGVTTVSYEQAQRLFAGRYLSWKALGGHDVSVRLVSREEGSGTRASFERLLMQGIPVALTARVLPNASEVVAFVARWEGSVGYVSAALADPRVDVLALNGILPTALNVQTGTYPLVRPVYMATLRPPSPAATLWLQAWRRPEVQARLAALYPPQQEMQRE